MCADQGDVVGIVGPVGSGKSALLSAVLGQVTSTIHTAIIIVSCDIPTKALFYI